MKSFLVVLIGCLAAAVAEPPAVTGVYFVAPPPPPPRVDLEKVTEDVMAQLKQIEGADSGEYHVYLPDGRLQKVTYTTAPLPASADAAEQLSQYKHRPSLPDNQFTFQNNQQVRPAFLDLPEGATFPPVRLRNDFVGAYKDSYVCASLGRQEA